jgi:hypothetical protein
MQEFALRILQQTTYRFEDVTNTNNVRKFVPGE